MFTRIEIEGFRCFEHYKLEDARRVNLLVGTNNSGKSALLEAIELLASAGDPEVLVRQLIARGETVDPEAANRVRAEPRISDLFHGHEIVVGSSVTIETKNDPTRRLRLLIEELDTKEFGSLGPSATDEPGDYLDNYPVRQLHITRSSLKRSIKLPIRKDNSLDGQILRLESVRRSDELGVSPLRFISTELMHLSKIQSLDREVALLPLEQATVKALQMIEPRLESYRVTSTLPAKRPAGRFGVLAKLRGVDQRVSFGSLGEGMWRMLGLALSLATARGGLLLVDEIDLGLHHSVQQRMWQMVLRTAVEGHTQVFATTHSLDCIRALAAAMVEERLEDEVSLFRLDRDRPTAIRYEPDEILAAADHGIEVR